MQTTGRSALGTVAAIAAILCGCRGPFDRYEGAPESAETMWHPAHGSQDGGDPDRIERLANLTAPATGAAIEDTLQADHEYTLPELIDFAQRNHPETRLAWERARMAAANLGLAESAYAPSLIVSAALGYEHLFLPFPDLPQIGLTDGYVTADTVVAAPTLRLNWLLFDFGRRSAHEDAARERVLVANFGFNAVHQQVVFSVTRAYYAYIDARDRVGVAQAEVESAATVESAVAERRARGLATELDALYSRQRAIAAVFEHEVALAHESDARIVLADAVGVLPTTKFGVAGLSDSPSTDEMLETVDEAIDRALGQRPDLAGRLAEVRAREADVRLAKAGFNPVVTMTGSVSMPYEALSIQDSSWFDAIEPRYGAGVMLSWPIFDGGERSQRLAIAVAARRAAEEEFVLARDAAVREVWKSYTDARLAMRRKPVSEALLAASEASYNASVEAYRNGVGDYVQLVEAQRSLTAARSVMLDTKTAVYTSVAALSLATGEITKP